MASSGVAMAVLVGVLLSTAADHRGGVQHLFDERQARSDVLCGSLIQKTHLEATVSSFFFAPAGGASTKGIAIGGLSRSGSSFKSEPIHQ